VPHKDKKAMEEAVVEGVDSGLFKNYTLVRPTLLTDGASYYDALRAGYTGRSIAEGDRWNAGAGIAKGYTVSRTDVGRFIFHEIVAKEGEGEWKGKKVTLTY
jgi:hypothetical protein